MASFTPASFSSPSPQILQRRSPRPQFGEHDTQPKTPSTDATDRANLSTSSPSAERSSEQRQQEAETQVRNLFQNLSERLSHFIKTVLKAFQKLIGNPKPLTELKAQYKSYRHEVRSQVQSPEAQQKAKALGEAIQKALPDSPLPETEKKQAAQFAHALQSPEGQQQYIEDVLNELPALSLHQHRQVLQSGVGKQLLAQNGEDYLQFLTSGKRRNPLEKYERLLVPKEQADTKQ